MIHTNNLPTLPSAILDATELRKGYWITIKGNEDRYYDPTAQGEVLEICTLGAVLRAFGVLGTGTQIVEQIEERTECGEYMIALARNLNPDLSSPDNPNYLRSFANDVKLSIVNWSDKEEILKADAIDALGATESELGYAC